MKRREAGLWRCSKCGESLTSRNQWHACGTFDLDRLFLGGSPHVRGLYQRFVELVEQCGPVTVIPQKTRVAFQVRMRFAALMPRKACLRGHLVLGARQEASCFEAGGELVAAQSPALLPARVGGRFHERAYRLGTRGLQGGATRASEAVDDSAATTASSNGRRAEPNSLRRSERGSKGGRRSPPLLNHWPRPRLTRLASSR
jgi:uncharacterized protein DUF5655